MITEVLRKLNLKDGMKGICLNSPDSFIKILKGSEGRIQGEMDGRTGQVEFCMAFVLSRDDVKWTYELIKEKLVSDAVLWFCFPKKSSRRIQAEVSRDEGWECLLMDDFLPVRSVAIDDDWSALRFRQRSNIPVLRRRTH